MQIMLILIVSDINITSLYHIISYFVKLIIYKLPSPTAFSLVVPVVHSQTIQLT